MLLARIIADSGGSPKKQAKFIAYIMVGVCWVIALGLATLVPRRYLRISGMILVLIAAIVIVIVAVPYLGMDKQPSTVSFGRGRKPDSVDPTPLLACVGTACSLTLIGAMLIRRGRSDTSESGEQRESDSC